MGDYHTDLFLITPRVFKYVWFFNFTQIQQDIRQKELIKEGYKENPTGWSQSISDHDTFEFLKKELRIKKRNLFY